MLGDRDGSGGTQRPVLATSTSSQPSTTAAVTLTTSGLGPVFGPWTKAFSNSGWSIIGGTATPCDAWSHLIMQERPSPNRDCCTETPEKTYEIAERYHRATGRLIKMNFDFSHLVIVKHLGPDNYIARLLDHPELVQNSEQVHFRPFNGHHCQVPVTHKGALTPEVKSYLVFVEALMQLWKKAPHNKNKTMFACPEMGPYWPGGGGYNITGLPPAWPDAAVLRGELHKAWKRA